MVVEGSLEEHLSKIVDRYSSLFTLPSYRGIVLTTFVICLIGGMGFTLSFGVFNVSFSNLFSGVSLGIILFSVTFLSDYITSKIFMKSDPILDQRRCSFLSSLSCLVLLAFSFVANLFILYSRDLNLQFKIISLGLFAALTLRLFVFSSVSFADYKRVFSSAVIQPTLVVFVLLSVLIEHFSFDLYCLFPFLASILTAAFGVRIFTYTLSKVIKEISEMPPLPLFKAFAANWTEDLNEPLEQFLEKIGDEKEIDASLLAFKGKSGMKAVIAVSSFHPGPFRNVGSSPLPAMIQSALEEKLKCVASVPHGISGHDLDLASQLQNRKLLARITKLANFRSFASHATPLIRVNEESASATCQIFGDCALITLTLAPHMMEDLPRHLSDEIIREAKRKGLASAIVIDAHNSIDGPFDPETASESLRRASFKALEEASHFKPSPLEVGVAKIVPKEFSIKDGMGPGGISVIVTGVDEQKAAYVTIDGNNMVSNLREKILVSLKDHGFDDGEVLTTDTHVVNGIVMVDRGYHPFGEVIDHDKIIGYITGAAQKAMKNLEPVESSCRTEVIQNIKVIGERQLNELCILAEETIKRTKKAAAIIFPSLTILLMVLFFLV